MTWYDPDQKYLDTYGHECLVCRKATKSWVAPLGIVSGRVPCCVTHSDFAVKQAWGTWVERRVCEQLGLPLD